MNWTITKPYCMDDSWPNPTHGNGSCSHGNEIPMGFPWKWELDLNKDGNGNRNKQHGSGSG